MLYHYVRLALRHMSKHRAFSLINSFGLTIGLASFILIGLYVGKQFSFDRFHDDCSSVFRVNKITNEKGQTQKDGLTPGLLASAIIKEIPGVSAATRIRPWFNDMLVSYDTIHLLLSDVVYADNSFLQLFNFPLLQGNRTTALAEPFTAVISESTAKKYFRNENPVGRTLTTLDNMAVKITGVSRDVPENSSIRFKLLISWGTLTTPANKDNFYWINNWTTQVVHTFIRMDKASDQKKAEEKISELLHRYRDEKEFQFRPYLQPLKDIHLHAQGILYSGAFRTNSIKIIYTLMIIAAFILLIASFNFINLGTAAALRRAKETGVQKVLGATQSQLIVRFFSESFLVCTVSLIAALLLVAILLPSFNGLTGSELKKMDLLEPQVMFSLATLLVFISLLSGLYPSVFLARFKTTDVFRNTVRSGKNSWMRTSLVTIQFSLSILLIIGTLVINKQIHFMADKDLGFQKDQVVVLQLASTALESRATEFMTALRKLPGIKSLSASNRVPGQGLNGYGIIPEGHTEGEHLMCNLMETDANFASTLHINMKEGRYFSPEFTTDTANSIVINEAMVRYLNWKNPIGKSLEIFEVRKGRVIGVVKDFNFASLRESVQPLAIVLSNNPLYVSIQLKPGTIAGTLPLIGKEWKKRVRDYPFDYFFLDEQINRFYQEDNRLLQAISVFALTAILIACMGLFGLSMYMVEQRTKEVGIRKVLGATVAGITIMLTKYFMRLMLIASLISFPLAWWAINNWLRDFAYRVYPGVGVFMIASFAASTIALFAVAFQAIRAAKANPVISLRSE